MAKDVITRHKTASLVKSFEFTFDAVTIPASTGANLSPNNYNSRPAGHSALGVKSVATGNANVLIRGFDVVYGNLYLYNNSTVAITTTPSLTVSYVKNEYY